MKNVAATLDRILRAGGGHIKKIHLGRWWRFRLEAWMEHHKVSPEGDGDLYFQGVPIEYTDDKYTLDVE